MRDIYILRILHEDQRWRATVTDTRSYQKYHFANLDNLLGFLQEMLEENTSLDSPHSCDNLTA